ncbi:MAG: amidophosphoribosyltransferase [Clostridiales bacterium]|nr:amidophosphoribosyltransferase [Clostridiales bacterium]
MRKLNEECGVLGIYDNDGLNVAHYLYTGLFALQHRGQQSCGIVTNNDAHLHQIKDKGLVSEVFNEQNLATLTGNIGVAHVRYAKEGDTSRENAQPLVSRYCKGSITLAHNGSILNANELRQELENGGAIFQSTNETEVIMHLIAIARTHTRSIEEAVLEVMGKIKGAYSMVLMSPRKLLGIRDPQGFRPLCLGKLGNDYILASESVAFDVMHAQFIRDIEPGEVVLIEEGGKLTSFKNHCGQKPALCVFEYVYFARPDSVIDGVSVYSARIEAGKQLAITHPVEADMVIGVPDSGTSFAHGYALQSGIPFGDGLIRNRYTGRTFIKQTQAEREMAVSIKLNVLKSNVAGKRIVMVDDSIVRGTTSKNLIKMLKDAGATEVHLRIASPAFLWPCYYGTDIPSREHLFAVRYSQEEMRKQLGADSLGFLPLESLHKIGLREDFGYCSACFMGKYPVE